MNHHSVPAGEGITKTERDRRRFIVGSVALAGAASLPRSSRAAANSGRLGVIIAGLRRPAANRASAGDTPVARPVERS